MRLHISQPIIPDRRERPNREKLHLSACISTGTVCPHCQLDDEQAARRSSARRPSVNVATSFLFAARWR